MATYFGGTKQGNNLRKSDAIQVSDNCLMELWDYMDGAPDNIAEKYTLVDSATGKNCGVIYRRKGEDFWCYNHSHGGIFAQWEALERAAFTHGVL